MLLDQGGWEGPTVVPDPRFASKDYSSNSRINIYDVIQSGSSRSYFYDEKGNLAPSAGSIFHTPATPLSAENGWKRNTSRNSVGVCERSGQGSV